MNAAQGAAYHGVNHRCVLFEDLPVASPPRAPASSPRRASVSSLLTPHLSGPRSASTCCRYLPALGAWKMDMTLSHGSSASPPHAWAENCPPRSAGFPFLADSMGRRRAMRSSLHTARSATHSSLLTAYSSASASPRRGRVCS